MIAVFLDEIQANENSIVRFFEWKSGGGAPTGMSNNSTITNDSGKEITPATNESINKNNVEGFSNIQKRDEL